MFAGYVAQEALGPLFSKAGGDTLKDLFYVIALCSQPPFSSTVGQGGASLAQGTCLSVE